MNRLHFSLDGLDFKVLFKSALQIVPYFYASLNSEHILRGLRDFMEAPSAKFGLQRPER